MVDDVLSYAYDLKKYGRIQLIRNWNLKNCKHILIKSPHWNKFKSQELFSIYELMISTRENPDEPCFLKKMIRIFLRTNCNIYGYKVSNTTHVMVYYCRLNILYTTRN